MPDIMWVVGGAARSRAVVARSAVRPTALSSARSTRRAVPTPTSRSARRTKPSTTARGAHTSARERGDLLLRLAGLLERDKAEIARAESLDTGKRLVESEYDVDDVVARLPLLRQRRRRGRRPHRRHRQRRSGQPDRPRAGRGLRPDHAVELSAAPDLLEGGSLPGGRQHVRAQAQRTDPPHGHPSHAPAHRGGSPGRRRQPRPRRRWRRRRTARVRPARRPGLVHRWSGDRAADHGRGRRQREAHRARARREEPQHRLRGRRPRRRARLRPDRGLPPLRSGLLRRSPPRHRGVDPRRVRRRGRRPRPAHPPRRSLRRECRDRPAHQRGAPREGREVRRGRPRRGSDPALRRRAPGGPRSGRRLRTTCPPCSTAARPGCR